MPLEYDEGVMRILAVVLTCLTTAGRALAQQEPVHVDPLPEPSQPAWVGMVIGLVLVLGVLVASFVSSKRGHQD